MLGRGGGKTAAQFSGCTYSEVRVKGPVRHSQLASMWTCSGMAGYCNTGTAVEGLTLLMDSVYCNSRGRIIQPKRICQPSGPCLRWNMHLHFTVRRQKKKKTIPLSTQNPSIVRGSRVYALDILVEVGSSFVVH